MFGPASVLYGLSHLVYLPHSQRGQFPLFHDAYFQRPNEVSRVFPLTVWSFFFLGLAIMHLAVSISESTQLKKFYPFHHKSYLLIETEASTVDSIKSF